jgi:hypothetical protein
MWFEQDQYSNEQLPIRDSDVIKQQHMARTVNYPYSAKSKAGNRTHETDNITVGHVVYLYQDKRKTSARPRYIVTSIDGEWCFIRKFTGKQLRATSYKVKLTECFKVPVQPITPPAAHIGS